MVIVAIKSDLLDEINSGVESSGLQTSVVDVAPMALYNAFRYNYSDLSDCSLVIDIGARYTNLVFVESHKVFSRSINTGGNTVTSAIARDFNEAFTAAEERKKRDGFVSLGGAYADPDDADVARVSKIIRNSMTRLHAEISRSIQFYRAQQGGGQPARVFLAGGSSSLPYIREFFQEKFQLPVEFLNPLRNVAVANTLDLEAIGRQAHTMGEVVGLALRSISACPMEVNLRPASVVRKHRHAEQRPAFILAGVSVVLAILTWWLYYLHAASTTDAVMQSIKPTVAQLQDFESRMTSVTNEIKGQTESAAPLLEAVRDRDYWLRILNDINSRQPKEYIWLTGFEPKVVNVETNAKKGAPQNSRNQAPQTQTVVQLKGLYLQNEQQTKVVDDFIKNLSESDLYTVDKEKQKRTVANDTEWAWEWSVPIVLKNPISLPTPKK